MDRAHYRRTIPGKSSDIDSIRSDFKVDYKSQNYTQKPGKFIEKVISQCIVCGIIMAIVLILNLIDTPISNNLRKSISSAISTQTTATEIKNVWQTAKNFADKVFGNTTKEPLQDNLSEASVNKENILITPTKPAEQLINYNVKTTTDSRIDEDILSQIESNRIYP